MPSGEIVTKADAPPILDMFSCPMPPAVSALRFEDTRLPGDPKPERPAPIAGPAEIALAMMKKHEPYRAPLGRNILLNASLEPCLAITCISGAHVWLSFFGISGRRRKAMWARSAGAVGPWTRRGGAPDRGEGAGPVLEPASLPDWPVPGQAACFNRRAMSRAKCVKMASAPARLNATVHSSMTRS